MKQRGKKPAQGHVANQRLEAPPFPAFLIKNTVFNIASATREAAQEEITRDTSLWPLGQHNYHIQGLKEKTSRTKEVTRRGSAVWNDLSWSLML